MSVRISDSKTNFERFSCDLINSDCYLILTRTRPVDFIPLRLLRVHQRKGSLQDQYGQKEQLPITLFKYNGHSTVLSIVLRQTLKKYLSCKSMLFDCPVGIKQNIYNIDIINTIFFFLEKYQ